jgi:hypothetical protein
MAEVDADVQIGELRGKKITDGFYVMEDGKIYGDGTGEEIKPAEGKIEIPDSALNNAEDLLESIKARKNVDPETVTEDA